MGVQRSNYPIKMERFHRQRGMTLLECLIALVISSVILGGLTHVLTIALASYDAAGTRHEVHSQAQAVMRRIENAVNKAERKKKEELIVKDASTSGEWFYRMSADGKKVIITYAWSAANEVLNEIDDTGIPRAILNDVQNFSVTAPASNDTALVAISLTVGSDDKELTLRETLRLGGAW